MKHIEHTEEDALPLSRKCSGIFSYNIPAEADMLIVFKHNDGMSQVSYNNDYLMKELFENFFYESSPSINVRGRL